MGGIVLDYAVSVFNGFVVFQPIINGIGGNLVSVQASKISTMLHQSSIIGIVPPHTKICESPWRALASGVPYAKTARILILMSIPGQLIFIYLADYIHMTYSTIGPTFVFSYLCVSLIQVRKELWFSHSRPWISNDLLSTSFSDLYSSLYRTHSHSFHVEIQNWSRQFGHSILDSTWRFARI